MRFGLGIVSLGVVATIATVGFWVYQTPPPSTPNTSNLGAQVFERHSPGPVGENAPGATPRTLPRLRPLPANEPAPLREIATAEVLQAALYREANGLLPAPNPDNLDDIGLKHTHGARVAGHVNGTEVPTDALRGSTQGALERIAGRIFDAQAAERVGCLETTVLQRQATAAGLSMADHLMNAYATLPEPTATDLAPLKSREILPGLNAAEAEAAARSMWRIERWLAMRARSILDHLQHHVSAERKARGLGECSRTEARGGYQAAEARAEYFRVLRKHFDRHAETLLLTQHAKRLSLSVEAVQTQAQLRTLPITDADVQAYMRREPAYLKHPQGAARARDVLRRLRAIEAEETLRQQLRQNATISFAVREPPPLRFHSRPVAPRSLASSSTGNRLIAFHGLGCTNCNRGSTLLLALTEAYGATITVEAADYFTRNRLAAYRGALALRCAPPSQQRALLTALARDFGTGEIAALGARARKVGLEVEPFLACLHADRFLPWILENVLEAERLGLERNIPAFFINGHRLVDLGDRPALEAQMAAAMH